jgi:hypothetical protein
MSPDFHRGHDDERRAKQNQSRDDGRFERRVDCSAQLNQ